MLEPLFEKTNIYKIGKFNSDLVNSERINDLQKIILLSTEDFEKNLELLEKMLPAIGFEPSGRLLLDVSKSDHFPIHELLKEQDGKTIIAFGIKPEQLCLPTHLQTHRLYNFEKMRITFTSSLATMQSNQEAKKAFWLFAKNELVDNS